MAVSALAGDGGEVGHDPADLEHDELVLLADLTNTNTRIARYIARVLNIGQGWIEHATALTVVERELGEHLVATGQSLLAHSHRPRRAAHLLCVPVPAETDTGEPPECDEA
jgi:hypothetical protein